MKKFALLVFFCFLNSNAEELIYNQEFDGSLKSEQLFLMETDEKEGYIEDGFYNFIYHEGDDYKFSTELLDIEDLDKSNYTIEAKLRYEDGEEDSQYGIILNMNNDASDFYLFTISDNGFYKIQSFSNDDYKDLTGWTRTDLINQEDWNILRVVKTNYLIRYYINGENVYNDKYFIPNGKWCGFYLSEEDQHIQVDYLKFWESEKQINVVENPLTDVKKIAIESINSPTAELSPKLSPDGRTIFFTRDDHPERIGNKSNQDIWFSKLQDGEWQKPELMSKPLNNSGSNTLITITPDYNTAYLSNKYDAEGNSDGPGLSIAKKGVAGWKIPTSIEVDNLYNNNRYVAYFISQDKKVLFSAIEQEDSRGGMDLYISFLKDDGSYTAPKNLGDNINTFADDFNPFLAADNRTLYYSTSGLPGYGKEDIWTIKRLDDTWLNWSEPKNLGPAINSSSQEYSFAISAKGDEAYMVSYQEDIPGYKGEGDIVKIELSKSAQPDPVVLVYGQVLNQKTNEPISAEISYFGLSDDKDYGTASSDPNTGEYKIILPRGVNYGFKSTAEGYGSVSQNLNIEKLEEYKEIERNLYLVPLEVGQTIRLNNIFFDTGEATLREESENELENLKKLLLDNKDMTIEISGHTDNVGNDKNNMKLSSDRALAVLNWLINNGISSERLTSKGYGETKPIATNKTEEGKQQNRRVEFTIVTQ